jgi:hypothetical protein
MASLAACFQELNALKAAGVLEEYAIGGAMAMVFWAEPTVTFDLDVFVFLPGDEQILVSLEPLYRALRARGFEPSAEHVLIHGIPVQFIVSPDELSDEAIERAATRELDGVPFRVMLPEHLGALWLAAGGAKRRERVEILVQSGAVTREAIEEVLRRHPGSAR